jgi:hypothetical protein
MKGKGTDTVLVWRLGRQGDRRMAVRDQGFGEPHHAGNICHHVRRAHPWNAYPRQRAAGRGRRGARREGGQGGERRRLGRVSAGRQRRKD